MQSCAQRTHSDIWSQLAFNARQIIWNRRPTEWKEMVTMQWVSDMQRDAWYYRQAQSKSPPGCLWRLWPTASTLTEPFSPDGNLFCCCDPDCVGRAICLIHLDDISRFHNIGGYFGAITYWLNWVRYMAHKIHLGISEMYYMWFDGILELLNSACLAQNQHNVFQSWEASRCVWENVECNHRSTNCRRVTDSRWTLVPAFNVTGISNDSTRSNWNLWCLVQEYHGSDCDKCGDMTERWRKYPVHLEVLPNEFRNQKWTRRDARVLIDIHLNDCRCFVKLPRFPEAIDFH
jgi:hypothetical protein